MLTLRFEEFLRSLKQNMDTPHSLLLGAGASVESGVLSASDCIWDWKREIYLSNNPAMIESCSNTKVENVLIAIQKWLDSSHEFPNSNSPEEYSFLLIHLMKQYTTDSVDVTRSIQHIVGSLR